MIWGEVDPERRFKVLVFGFVIVVAVLSVCFGVVAAIR